MKLTCENCGFGLETDHQGDWDHTCPDGSHGHVVYDGMVDNAFLTSAAHSMTIALTDLTRNTHKVADTLNAMWTIYNQTYKT